MERAMESRWRSPPLNWWRDRFRYASPGCQSDLVEQPQHLVHEPRLRHDPVDRQRLGNHLERGLERIHGVVRILKDHLHLASERHALARGQSVDRLALEPDRSRGGIDEPHDRPAERRLAAAALPDHCQHFAPLQRETDAVDGPDDAMVAGCPAIVDGEMDLQIVDFQQRFGHRRSAVQQTPNLVAALQRHDGRGNDRAIRRDLRATWVKAASRRHPHPTGRPSVDGLELLRPPVEHQGAAQQPV